MSERDDDRAPAPELDAQLEARLQRLAREIEPPREVWPAIELRIRQRDRRLQALGWSIAASIVALGIGIWIGRAGVPLVQVAARPAQEAPRMAAAAAAPSVLDAAYADQRRRQLERAGERLQALPEPTRAEVAASLETLQRSIAQIHAALGRDPANALLQELLTNAYQDEARIVSALDEAAARSPSI